MVVHSSCFFHVSMTCNPTVSNIFMLDVAASADLLVSQMDDDEDSSEIRLLRIDEGNAGY